MTPKMGRITANYRASELMGTLITAPSSVLQKSSWQIVESPLKCVRWQFTICATIDRPFRELCLLRRHIGLELQIGLKCMNQVCSIGFIVAAAVAALFLPSLTITGIIHGGSRDSMHAYHSSVLNDARQTFAAVYSV